MAKKLRRILGLLLLLIVVLAGGLWYSIDGVMRSQIAGRASAALGVKTTLADAALNIFAGSLTLRQLNIANPPGYAGAYLLQLQTGSVKVRLGSLLTNTVQINTIVLDGLNMTLDQNGLNSNLSTVMDHLKRQQASAPAAAPGGHPASAPPASSGGKTLAIDRVLVEHITVTVRPTLTSGQPTVPVVLHLKQIEIDQPTNPNGRPFRLADLISQVLAQVAAEALQNPQLPSSLHQSLQAVGHDMGNLIQRATQPIAPAVNKAVQSLQHLLSPANRPAGGGQ